MNKYVVFSDSSCDMPKSIAEKNDVRIVPLKVSFDRVNKLAEGVDISLDEFYARMNATPVVPKTYFPTVREYVTAFKTALNKGQDVLCLCLSSKLSKGYESACHAREILTHSYKNNKILILDTLLATGSQAALALNAARLRDSGQCIDDTYKRLTALRDGTKTIFTVSSLDQLARGGRMSRATATLGTLLHINPIIHLENGELISREKAIGRARALTMLMQLSMEAINKNVNGYDITVFHSRSQGEAKKLESDLRSTYGVKSFNPMLEIGASIGSHTGASVVALNCMQRI